MHDVAQFIIGGFLGFMAWRTLRNSSLSIEDPATRWQAIAVLGTFALVAGLGLGLADLLSR